MEKETGDFRSINIHVRVDALDTLTQMHIDMLSRFVSSGNRALYQADLLFFAAVQRSFSLIAGFKELIRCSNALCAIPLLRLQIDTIMRLNACNLVEDHQEVIMALMEGTPLSKLKDKNGYRMSDKHLREEATKLFPWLSSVYERTSAFVHFSDPIMFGPITSFDDVTSKFELQVTVNGPPWKEKDKIEAMDAFIESTKAILLYGHSYLHQRDQPKKRSQPESD